MVRKWLAGMIVCTAIAMQSAVAAPQSLRVLFVGNSLTYFNSLPALTAAVAAQINPPERMQVEMLAAPGATIRQHLDAGHLQDVLGIGRYDVVVFQELGGLPVCAPDFPPCRESPAALAEAVRLIKASGARAVLLGTWNLREIQPQMSAATAALAKRLQVEVVDWGGDIKTFTDLHPDMPLLVNDGHPLPLGSWLAAAHLAKELTGRALPDHAPHAVCAPEWAHATPPPSISSVASQQRQPPLNCSGIPDSTYQLLRSMLTRK